MTGKSAAFEPSGVSRAVFLDRDGTLVEDRGYLRRPEDVVWFEDTVSALSILNRRFSLFVVSNQSGVSRGEISMEDVIRVNSYMNEYLEDHGIYIRRWYVCPHVRSDGCLCIKPKPYFLHQASRELGVSLGDSYTIGDHPHDAALADEVGGTGIYLLTGHGRKHLCDVPRGTPVFPSLRGAVAWIESRD